MASLPGRSLPTVDQPTIRLGVGDDGEWDNWRLEGPSFVWYFRGQPHVHIWINVADDPSVPLNAKG